MKKYYLLAFVTMALTFTFFLGPEMYFRSRINLPGELGRQARRELARIVFEKQKPLPNDKFRSEGKFLYADYIGSTCFNGICDGDSSDFAFSLEMQTQELVSDLQANSKSPGVTTGVTQNGNFVVTRLVTGVWCGALPMNGTFVVVTSGGTTSTTKILEPETGRLYLSNANCTRQEPWYTFKVYYGENLVESGIEHAFTKFDLKDLLLKQYPGAEVFVSDLR